MSNDAIVCQMKDPRVEEPVVESLSDNDIRPNDVESKLAADSITGIKSLFCTLLLFVA